MSVSSALFTVVLFSTFIGGVVGYVVGKRVGFVVGKRYTLEDEHGCH